MGQCLPGAPLNLQQDRQPIIGANVERVQLQNAAQARLGSRRPAFMVQQHGHAILRGHVLLRRFVGHAEEVVLRLLGASDFGGRLPGEHQRRRVVRPLIQNGPRKLLRLIVSVFGENSRRLPEHACPRVGPQGRPQGKTGPYPKRNNHEDPASS